MNANHPQNQSAPRRPLAIKRRATQLRAAAAETHGLDLKQWQALELIAAAHGAPSYQAYVAAPGQYTAGFGSGAAQRCADRAYELNLNVNTEAMYALLRPLIPNPHRTKRAVHVLGRLTLPAAPAPRLNERTGRVSVAAQPNLTLLPAGLRGTVLANSVADAADIQRVARSAVALVEKHGGELEVGLVREALGHESRWLSVALKHAVLSGQLNRVRRRLFIPQKN